MQTFTDTAFRLCAFCAVCIFCANAKAQDPAYTQAFLSPLYLNPAATGAGEHDFRISAAYRRQWWLVPSNFHSMAFSVDKFLPDLKSGVGILATKSSAGYLRKQAIYGTFAYTICPGYEGPVTNEGEPAWFWSTGFQAGVGQSRLDYSKLYFADQLTTAGVLYPSVSSANPPANSGRVYPDFAAGTLFQYRSDNSRWLVGLSAHHVNRPDESLTSTTVSPLPVKWTGILQYGRVNTSNTWAFNLSFIGYRQGIHTRYQTGFEATHNDYSNISVGLFYAGGMKTGDINTVSFTVSLNLFNESGNRMRAGIAHDSQVGSRGYMRTGGSSEMGMVWDYATNSGIGDSPCKPKVNGSGDCWKFRN